MLALQGVCEEKGKRAARGMENLFKVVKVLEQHGSKTLEEKEKE